MSKACAHTEKEIKKTKLNGKDHEQVFCKKCGKLLSSKNIDPKDVKEAKEFMTKQKAFEKKQQEEENKRRNAKN